MDGLNISCVIKAREKYFVFCDDEHVGETLRRVARQAMDPELSLTFRDAERVARDILRQSRVPLHRLEDRLDWQDNREMKNG